MTAPRDTASRIAMFLEEGPAELSPRLVAAIRDDVHATHQRVPRRARGMPSMPRLVAFGSFAAVVLIVGAVAVGGRIVVPTPGTGEPLAGSSAAVAPGEEWIAYGGSDDFVSLVRPDGSGRHRVVDSGDVYQGSADWSPDGSRLVFSRADGSSSNLWVVNADGTGGRALTPAAGRCGPCPDQGWPRWSPDGSQIAFIDNQVDVARVLRNDLSIVDVATGAVRTIVSSDSRLFAVPSWSPDGHRIVLEYANYATLATAGVQGVAPTSVGLAIVDLTAAVPALAPIRGLPGYPGHPDWSPDGSRIVFRTNTVMNPTLLGDAPFFVPTAPVDPGPGSAIYTVAPDGGDIVEVLRSTDVRPILDAPAWTPDGTSILHVSRASIGSGWELRALDPSTGSTSSATGDVTTLGIEPRLRPLP